MIFNKTIEAWTNRGVKSGGQLDTDAYSIKATVMNILRELLDSGKAQSVKIEIDDISDFLLFIEKPEFRDNYYIIQDIEDPNVFTFTLRDLELDMV